MKTNGNGLQALTRRLTGLARQFVTAIRSAKQLMPLLLVLAYSQAATASTLVHNYDPVMRSSSDSRLGVVEGDYLMARGSVLMNVKEPVELKTAGATVNFQKGTVALLTREEGYFRVANLCENKEGSIKIELANSTITLCAGNDFVMCKTPDSLIAWLKVDGTARRNIEINTLPNGAIYAKSEYFIPTLIEHAGIMRALIKSTDKPEKELYQRVLKICVCIDVATASHGKYSFVK